MTHDDSQDRDAILNRRAVLLASVATGLGGCAPARQPGSEGSSGPSAGASASGSPSAPIVTPMPCLTVAYVPPPDRAVAEIFFEQGSSELSPGSLKLLDGVGGSFLFFSEKSMAKPRYLLYLVEDPAEKEKASSLARARFEAIRKYLERFGLALIQSVSFYITSVGAVFMPPPSSNDSNPLPPRVVRIYLSTRTS